jgi:calcineurin-like phosphoesterase family protein
VSRVFFISDLHLGHRSILQFAGPLRGGTTVDEHDEWLVNQWNSVVGNRDLVWVLGDVAFDIDKMPLLAQMKGRKKLVRGNHDKFDLGVYLKYFDDVHGLVKYRDFWLSHAPIHPSELRGRKNIHGHTHHTCIPSPDYVNVSVEQLYGVPVTFEKVAYNAA